MTRTIPLARWPLSSFVLTGMVLICAGRIKMPMLMAYLAVFAGMGLATALAAEPSLDGERRKPGPEEIHRHSRRGATVLLVATVAVAALGAGRFHWSDTLSGTVQMAALTALVFAAGLQVWAIMVNTFFSTAIQIQTKRGHQLVTRGPYRFIRHPGYLAMIIIMQATALALGSLIALIPAFCYSAMILWRVQREEGFLRENLASYSKYAESVRHRLIPVLW